MKVGLESQGCEELGSALRVSDIDNFAIFFGILGDVVDIGLDIKLGKFVEAEIPVLGIGAKSGAGVLDGGVFAGDDVSSIIHHPDIISSFS